MNTIIKTDHTQDDIVVGEFCSPYIKNDGGWLLPGYQIVKDYNKALELTQNGGKIIKKNKERLGRK